MLGCALVAGAGTVAKLADGSAIVRAGLVIAGVATRAIRSVRRVGPGDDFGVGAVASGALQVAAMIERLVRCRRMPEFVGAEAIGVVAGTAFPGGAEVTGILADRDHAVMAGRAGAQHLGVIDRKYGRPGRRCMTVLADIGRSRMLQVLAGRDRAVMAAEAITGDIGVVIGGRQPGHRGMAVVAIAATRDVIRILAGGDRTVVAGSATAEHLRMIDGEWWYPDGWRMAVFADVGGLYVGRIFAGSRNAIVAVTAIARDVGVVEVRGQPAIRRVAILTDVAARNMCRCLAGCRDAVVTARTVAEDTGVIEIRRHPACGCMAVVAVVTAGDVRRGLARCDRAVVAGAAVSDHLRMINGLHRCKSDHAVAVLADITGIDMVRVLAGCIHTVVAARAVAGDIDVIEIRGYPAGRRVTVIAAVAAGNVSRGFAGRSVAVMAGLAGANDLRVIDAERRRKGAGRMAVLADRRGQDVCSLLAGRIHTIVATRAVAGDAGVIEVCGHPARGRMAIIAAIAARQMRRGLAGRIHAVVAGTAAAKYLCMVDGIGRHELHRVVAVLANIRGLRVAGAFTGCVGAVMAGNAVARDVVVTEVRGHPASREMAVDTVVAAGDVVWRLAGRDTAVVA